jgi:hypothetical protein
LTDGHAFGLTSASPLQRAICRIADGRPLGALAHDPAIAAAFGVPKLPACMAKPRELDILSGVRSGKSILAACLGVHLSQTCDVSGLRPGDVCRIPIVSLTLADAHIVLNHLIGGLTHSPFLKEILLEEPTSDVVLVRHPTGRPVEITVRAGKKAGGSLLGCWMPGVIFDEYTRMEGADEAVVNWDHQRQAVLFRILPGGQICSIGSPWAAFGPAYRRAQELHGKPSERCVIVWAPGWVMNPNYWTLEKCKEASETDPDAFRTDGEAKFSTPEEALLPLAALERATRSYPVEYPPEPALSYVATMDPATRGNGWTLVVTTRRGTRKIVVLAREWRGSRHRPLDPGKVLDEIRVILAPYFPGALDRIDGRVRGIPIDTDQAMGDALVRLAADRGLRLNQWKLSEQEKTRRYLDVRDHLLMVRGDGLTDVELPPDEQLRADLLHIRKRLSKGTVAIVLPETENGRHCDFAPSIMLAVSRWIADEKPANEAKEDPETTRLRAETLAKWRDRGRWPT